MMRRALLVLLGLLLAAPAGASVVLTDVTPDALRDAQGQPTRAVHHARGYITPNIYGPGCAWADINRDGWPDLLIGNGSESNDGTTTTGNYCFLNNGDGTFTDVSEEWRVHSSRVANGLALADMDNDGDLDLAVGNYYAQPQLFVGGSTAFDQRAQFLGLDPLFPLVSGDYPLPETMGVAFGDYDRDGYVDLYVANYRRQRDILLHSTGGGYFERTNEVDVTVEGFGFMGVFLDFDDDRDLDIYVANDFGYNFLFENQGPGSGFSFLERARQYKVSGGADSSEPKSMGMGVGVADFDNDLDLDIYVTNYRLNALYVNQGPGAQGGWRFTEEAAARGVEVAQSESSAGWNDWGCDFADLDNDGDLDLVVAGGYIFAPVAAQPYALADKLWLNSGPPDYTFTDVSDASGFNQPGYGRGLATADYDRDGDLDVAVTNVSYHFNDGSWDEQEAKLFRNDQDLGHHWVQLQLEGGGVHEPGLGCNLSAAGARVYLTSGDLVQMREVQAGSSYLSQNSLEVEFGLGARSAVDEVIVRWPCGAEEIFSGVGVDAAWRLEEGSGSAVAVPVAISSFSAEVVSGGIRLRWVVAPGTPVRSQRVERAGEDGSFRTLPVAVDLENHVGTALDTTVRPGERYGYRLILEGDDGIAVESPTVYAVAGGDATPGRRAVLGQNFPNPFNPSTTLYYTLPEAMPVRLEIYDPRGRRVRTLVDGRREAGQHRLVWDGRDEGGREVPAGVYHYRLRTDRGTSVRRMVLAR